MMDLFGQTKGATFSENRLYRYKLWRIWNEKKPIAMCIGLNPSTANANKNDPTITNLVKMLNILGYGGFYMTNLFAYISSKPEKLLTCIDPVGENDQYLIDTQSKCDCVIACWGNFKNTDKRIDQVMQIIENPLCFGVNKNGTPCHPLAMMYQGKTKNPKLINYSI